MKIYDVIIVGAGPSGLNCAQKLVADSDKSVLILEQNDVIGPKVCAGGLTYNDIEYLKLPNILLDKKFKCMIMHTNHNSHIIKFDDFLLFTIDRKNLGHWQLEKLRNTRTEIRTKSCVTKIGKNYVVVNDSEKIGYRYLVGADGANSIVRKYLKLPIKDLMIGIHYIIPTNKFKKIEVFFDTELLPIGYLWIFPHTNYVSIGCGCSPRLLPMKRIRENFHNWLRRKNINVSKGELQAYPINFDYRGFRFGNVFLVGEAAGLTSGLTGKGIYQALVSGEEAAKTIIDEGYVSAKMNALIKTKRYHNFFMKIFNKSGSFRKIEYEMGAMLLKKNIINKKEKSWPRN